MSNRGAWWAVSFAACVAIGCSDSEGGPDDMMMSPIQPSAGAGAGAIAGAGGGADTGGVVAQPTGGTTAGSSGAGSGGAPSIAGTGGSTGEDAGAMEGDGGTPDPGMPMFDDPGTGPWMLVPSANVEAECKMDPQMLTAANSTIGTSYAVIRYGKLCHESGSDSPTEAYSATKTLGALVTGIASYETRMFAKSGPMTGQLSDTDLATHWLGTVSYNDQATIAHVLGMIGHNANLAYDQRSYMYDTVGSVQINSLSDMVNAAIAQDAARLGANIEAFTQTFLYDALGMTDSTWSGGSSNKTYAYTWSTTLHDMARVGVLILHRGVYDGKRVLDEGWTYKMTHPAFEDANTAYGYLTWLNAAAGGTGPGGAGTGTAGDECAPYAVWPSYPHGTVSEAPDCLYGDTFTCEQEHDIGVWSAQGAGGQFIVGHPGLDLVIVAKNFSGGGGPRGLWAAIRPALVALDPMFMGDETGFCAAYRAGSYAPDLMTPIVAPTD